MQGSRTRVPHPSRASGIAAVLCQSAGVECGDESGPRRTARQVRGSAMARVALTPSPGRHVALLRVRRDPVEGPQFELEPIPLTTVRPILLREVCGGRAVDAATSSCVKQVKLADLVDDVRNVRRVSEALSAQVQSCWRAAWPLMLTWWFGKVEMMIEDSRRDLLPPRADMLPLLRLKVEYGRDAAVLNVHRFGQAFEKRVR